MRHVLSSRPAVGSAGLSCSFIETLSGQGKRLLEDGHLNLSTPEARKGLQLLVDLVNKYEVTPDLVTEYREQDVYPYALANDAYFFRGWPGNMKEFEQQYPRQVSQIRVAAIPHFENQEAVAVFGGWNLMVSKQSPNKSAAIEFMVLPSFSC